MEDITNKDKLFPLLFILILSISMIGTIDQYMINYIIPVPTIIISSCGNLNQAGYKYILNSNVSSGGTCFTISANNITLDGQGNIVNYSTTSAGYGIRDSGGYDNIILQNLTLNQQNSNLANSHGIYLVKVVNSNADNININTKNNAEGLYLSSSSSNKFSNFSVSTTSSGAYGIYTTSSNTNLFSRFNIRTSGSNSHGVYLSSSNFNTYSDLNILTSGSGAIGIYVNGNNNNFLNINLSASGNGVRINSANYNNIKDGSIISSLTNDYYLQNAGTTNSFTNTNFTTRKIYFNDNNSKFNYVYNNIGLNTSQIISPTRTLTITRKLINWNQTNVSWQETVSALRRLNYEIGGLMANTNYSVWNGSIISYNITTDINGNLPAFSINLTTAAKVIKVLSY